MSRYTGPRLKIMRALGIELPGLSRKRIERRPYPPGQHGNGTKRRRETEYGLRLREKQKLRHHYGLNERQLRRVVDEAAASQGATGAKIIELLERRLDNLVFRAGFARTIPAARQMVTHGHVRVNGKRLDIPSARLRAGDVLSLDDKTKKSVLVTDTLSNFGHERPAWISFDTNELTARLATLPDEHAVPFQIELRLIVEYYSR